MDPKYPNQLTFVLVKNIGLSLRTADPAFASALQHFAAAVEDLLSNISNRRLFRQCAFSSTDKVDLVTKQGWDLVITCFSNGNELARFSFADFFLATATAPAAHLEAIRPLAADLAREAQVARLWGSLSPEARAALQQRLAADEGAAAGLGEVRARVAAVVAADEELLGALPAQLRATLTRLAAADEDGSLQQDAAAQQLLEEAMDSLRAAAPRAQQRLPPVPAATLGALLADLAAAEAAAPTPLAALRTLVAFLALNAVRWQEPPAAGLAQRLGTLLGAISPLRLLRALTGAASLVGSVPGPNRVARELQLRGEVVALTLAEGALDLWDLACKLSGVALRHARRSVRPLLIMAVTHRLHATLQRAQRARQEAEEVRYILNEGAQQDLLDAIREAREGLITDDVVDEKRQISAAILRRLDREAYDRMLQYMAFDMANEINLHQGADSGESEEIGRWDATQARLYDWFYVMSRFGKNSQELAGRIKTYPQDLDPSKRSFNTWVKTIIENGTGRALPAPDAIVDPLDPVDAICASPSFSALDPLAVKTALAQEGDDE